MPSSTSGANARREIITKELIDLRAKVAELTTENVLLKKNNGELLDDVGDSLGEDANYKILYDGLKVKHDLFLVKYEALEKAKSEAHRAIRNFRDKLTARLGKNGLKKFLSCNASIESLAVIDKNLKINKLGNDEPAISAEAASTILSIDNPTPNNTPDVPNPNPKETNDNDKKRVRPSTSTDLNTLQAKSCTCGNNNNNDTKRDEPRPRFETELIDIIGWLCYSLSLANEANKASFDALTEVKLLAKSGNRKLDKNFHYTSIQVIFDGIYDAVDVINAAKEKFLISDKAVLSTYNLPKNHRLFDCRDYMYHRRRFFWASNSRYDNTVRLLSSDQIEKIVFDRKERNDRERYLAKKKNDKKDDTAARKKSSERDYDRDYDRDTDRRSSRSLKCSK